VDQFGRLLDTVTFQFSTPGQSLLERVHIVPNTPFPEAVARVERDMAGPSHDMTSATGPEPLISPWREISVRATAKGDLQCNGEIRIKTIVYSIM
jgi:hypothetical protein